MSKGVITVTDDKREINTLEILHVSLHPKIKHASVTFKGIKQFTHAGQKEGRKLSNYICSVESKDSYNIHSESIFKVCSGNVK